MKCGVAHHGGAGKMQMNGVEVKEMIGMDGMVKDDDDDEGEPLHQIHWGRMYHHDHSHM